MAADTLLVRRYEIHSNEPLDEWQLCVLEDSTNEARKVLVALGAMETSILGHLAVMLATIGANNVLLCSNTPTALKDGLLALVI
jgi:aspartate/glutamate racemase